MWTIWYVFFQKRQKNPKWSKTKQTIAFCWVSVTIRLYLDVIFILIAIVNTNIDYIDVSAFEIYKKGP